MAGVIGKGFVEKAGFELGLKESIIFRHIEKKGEKTLGIRRRIVRRPLTAGQGICREGED